MARSRFIKDAGLTVRMTTVMFLLGALFVALVVTLMYTFPNFAFLIGIGGIGVAFYQWWSSDKVAMRRCAPARSPRRRRRSCTA